MTAPMFQLIARLPAQDAEDIEKIDDAAQSLTGIDIAIGVGALVLAWPLAIAVGWAARKIVRRVPGSHERLAQVFGLLARAVVVFLAVAIALSRFGVDVGWFTVTLLFLGALVFLMLRPLLENFAAGLLLETRSSYALGDEIETNGHRGEVIEVNGRTTVLLTRDQRRVHIPSKDVLESVLVVYTGPERRRSSLVLEVDDVLEIDRVTDVLVGATSESNGVLQNPPPSVRAQDFGNGTVRLELRWWHGPSLSEESQTRDAVVRALSAGLPAAGIGLPAPELQVTLTSDD